MPQIEPTRPRASSGQHQLQPHGVRSQIDRDVSLLAPGSSKCLLLVENRSSISARNQQRTKRLVFVLVDFKPSTVRYKPFCSLVVPGGCGRSVPNKWGQFMDRAVPADMDHFSIFISHPLSQIDRDVSLVAPGSSKCLPLVENRSSISARNQQRTKRLVFVLVDFKPSTVRYKPWRVLGLAWSQTRASGHGGRFCVSAGGPTCDGTPRLDD